MQRGLASAAYITSGGLLGLGGLLVVSFALLPTIEAVLLTVGTNGAFLLMIDVNEFFEAVVLPLLVALLGAGIAIGGLALLLQGFASALGDAPTRPDKEGDSQ